MFQICVPNQKVQGKKTNVTILNAVIKNIKIQNIFDIIEISKSMEPNKCINFFKNVNLSVSYDFSKFNGS
jgi:hypothetical protein